MSPKVSNMWPKTPPLDVKLVNAWKTRTLSGIIAFTMLVAHTESAQGISLNLGVLNFEILMQPKSHILQSIYRVSNKTSLVNNRELIVLLFRRGGEQRVQWISLNSSVLNFKISMQSKRAQGKSLNSDDHILQHICWSYARRLEEYHWIQILAFQERLWKQFKECPLTRRSLLSNLLCRRN